MHSHFLSGFEAELIKYAEAPPFGYPGKVKVREGTPPANYPAQRILDPRKALSWSTGKPSGRQSAVKNKPKELSLAATEAWKRRRDGGKNPFVAGERTSDTERKTPEHKQAVRAMRGKYDHLPAAKAKALRDSERSTTLPGQKPAG